MDNFEVWPGRPYPLGAAYDGVGVNFAVLSQAATRVEICLYDQNDSNREIARFELSETTDDVYHGYVSGLRPGALYGLRVHGPYDPQQGLRFNPHKLLVDPYAKALLNEVDWSQPVFGYELGHELGDLKMDTRDSAPGVPKSVVVANDFDWAGDRRPETPWRKTVIYEAHVRGLTMRHPAVPEQLRGTYAALALPEIIDYLVKLGITAIELLPVHEAADDSFLTDKGLCNYWGYNTLNFFAPEQRYSSQKQPGAQVNEFKQMVKALHNAGIEVILDVVYNHTCEGNHMGPTLSLRGIDNGAYYWLMPDDPRHYLDFTGCGNSLKAANPAASRLIVDSLRYWATEMHVDGFRFDLANTLGRAGQGAFERESAFFQIINHDPVLQQVKLIAEPWDCGMGGYSVGQFPAPWREWNGKYRDAMRRFWKGDENQAAEVGYRFTGSSDLYQLGRRRPQASINFITCHDGFTLHDLVSYSHKHNEANGEHNRDGADDNQSWNCGAEGETQDSEIIELRERQKRNLLTSLMISQGVPMLTAGDEIGHTQDGNNNTYCQDNDLAWLNWDLDERRKGLLEFAQALIDFRHNQPVLQRRRHFLGQHIWDSEHKDLAWYRPDGSEMQEEDWQKPFVRSLAFLLGGDAIPTLDERGKRIIGDGLLVLINAHHESIEFTLPVDDPWHLVIDTYRGSVGTESEPAPKKVEVKGRSMMVYRQGSRR